MAQIEEESVKIIPNRLASAKEARAVALEAKVTALEEEAQQREQACERVKELEEQLATRSTETDKAKSQLMEAACMVKSASEQEILVDRQLCVRIEEVRRLREQHSLAATPTSSVHPGTVFAPLFLSLPLCAVSFPFWFVMSS